MNTNNIFITEEQISAESKRSVWTFVEAAVEKIKWEIGSTCHYLKLEEAYRLYISHLPDGYDPYSMTYMSREEFFYCFKRSMAIQHGVTDISDDNGEPMFAEFVLNTDKWLKK